MIAVCVGHSRRGDSVAVSVDGTSEWFYNARLAEMVAMRLEKEGADCDVISKYQGAGYGSAMTWLAKELRRRGATLAAELHFNWASTRAASGHEWLYSGSQRGRMLAAALNAAMAGMFPERMRRGLKVRGPKENGGGFLHKTHCPAVVCEPFFGSSPDDWRAVGEHPEQLARALASGLLRAHEVLTGKAGL